MNFLDIFLNQSVESRMGNEIANFVLMEDPKIKSPHLKRFCENSNKNYHTTITIKQDSKKSECFQKALKKYLFDDNISEILKYCSFDYMDASENDTWFFDGEITKKISRDKGELLAGFYCNKIPKFNTNDMDVDLIFFWKLKMWRKI